MEFDAEYDAYLAMTTEERIEAEYDTWLESLYTEKYAEESADGDVRAY